MNNSQVVLECRDLNRIFDSGPQRLHILKNINFSVKKGERVAIVGASGSGKSTLLHCLGGLDDVSSGKVFLGDYDLVELGQRKKARLRNRQLGFVYQFHHLLQEFSAVENVAMPLLIRGLSVDEAAQKAGNMLEKVGLSHRVLHKPSELSGGERQRAAIARALVTDPVCVLADEPTGNLDSKTAADIYELMLDLNQDQQTSFVLVTHDRHLADKMDRVFYLTDGELTTD